MSEKNSILRKQIINSCSRVVVKIGTRLLTEPDKIPLMVSNILKLRKKGKKVILVSSGAVGIGMKTLGIKKRPKKVSEIQGLAAVGQSKLVAAYDRECRKFGFHAAQLLLTSKDLTNRQRHLNVLNCVNALWARDVLPVLNENDTVSVDELTFGDNDLLAGLVAALTRSELTVIFTTVDGFHEKKGGELGGRVSVVEKITTRITRFASGTDSSTFSIGGMRSKIKAARTVTKAGEYLWIADGRDPFIMDKILEGRDVGTLFLPLNNQLQSRKRWIGLFSSPKGTIVVDAGAAEALTAKGKSLLPSGMIRAEGRFKAGDTVEIANSAGTVLAKGLTNYSNTECSLIAGMHSSCIATVLKNAVSYEVVVHRDNLYIER